MEPLPQCNLKSFPRRVQSISPVGSLSPVDSGSYPLQSMNASLPGFIQRLFSTSAYNWVILSPKTTERSSSAKFFLFPSRVHQFFQQSSTMVSPAELSSTSAKYLSFPTEFTPRRVIYSPSLFPNGVIFSYRYSCNYHPQRKQRSILQH